MSLMTRWLSGEGKEPIGQIDFVGISQAATAMGVAGCAPSPMPVPDDLFAAENWWV
jgi:hypothetical protein